MSGMWLTSASLLRSQSNESGQKLTELMSAALLGPQGTPTPVERAMSRRSSSATSRLLSRYKMEGKQSARRHVVAVNTCTLTSSGTR